MEKKVSKSRQKTTMATKPRGRPSKVDKEKKKSATQALRKAKATSASFLLRTQMAMHIQANMS